MWVRTTIVLVAVSRAAMSFAGEPAPPDFAREIQPVLAERCFACHGPDGGQRQADLRLDRREDLLAGREHGLAPVVPGDLQRSLLWQRVTTDDSSLRMPPPETGPPLAPAQLNMLRRWIEAGARWENHWAYTAPRRPAIPDLRSIPTQHGPSAASADPVVAIESTSGERQAIDRFVRAALQADGLEPSPQADPETLIRRVTLDLTGLPPTPEEVDAFLGDSSPDAYERLVDRLLASPRYGERMALGWLDAARFADTHGYLFDTERSMWRWRDQLIDALNRNQPFDQFTIEQLAGDLLPDATLAQRVASGFNRNHIINNEAGATPEEYLVENIVDRVNTTATVWMGLTLQCCQCHDHKYDPFTQREYYQLYAFFNDIDELGLDGLNTNARPTLTAPTENDRAKLLTLEKKLSADETTVEQLRPEIEAAQAEWEAAHVSGEIAEAPGLAGHWPLDGKADDQVCRDLPTVVQAAPAAYANGLFGQAGQFDGLGYLDGGDRFGIERTESFTFAAWVHPQTIAGRLTLISRMQGAEQLFRGFAWQLVDGVPTLFLVHRFPDNMLQVATKAKLRANAWQHVAVTYNGSAQAAGVKLYIDGQPQEIGVTIESLKDSITCNEPLWIANGHPGAKFKGLLDEVRIYRRALCEEEIASLPGLSIDSLLATATDQRTDESNRRLREYYLTQHAPQQWRDAFAAAKTVREQLDKFRRELPTVMVMQQRAEPRETRMLVRGAYNRPGDAVAPGVPAILPPLAEGDAPTRLSLARWLVRPDHPLTARVTVNRLWQHCFGTGIVRTAEDFGVQGDRPSHPQLLDWLAMELVERGWDMKTLHRQIVTSAIYRQASRITPELAEIDPLNHRLARGPRVRLPGEMIRDQALAASGLLVGKIGGPSVKPYQPEGLWREVAFDFSGANLTAQVYAMEQGANLYRRSMYTFWKRTAPPPTMLLFDAPDRERCVVRRENTNTPLQALALMNDPTFLEAARKLAERLVREAGPEPRAQIDLGFRLLLARRPRAEELDALAALYARQLERYGQQPDAAQALLTIGQSPTDPQSSAAHLAALTVVASALLNLDETVTKR